MDRTLWTDASNQVMPKYRNLFQNFVGVVPVCQANFLEFHVALIRLAEFIS
jgi:hypothetical protein